MSIAPPALVLGAPRPLLPYGLFSVLSPREGSADRWEAGVIFEGIGCAPAPGEGVIGPYDCDEDGETEGLPKEFDGHLTVNDANQFTIYQSQVCSPTGNSLEASVEVARQRLAQFEELLVERELWKVLDTLDTYFELPASAPDPDDIIDAVFVGISTLEREQGIRFGSQGVIHMSRSVAMMGIKAKALETKSNRLFTTLGTPVVAGSGYGTTEMGVPPKIVLTPQLFGYRSEVFTSSNRPGDLLDRRNDNLYGVAERNWLVGFEKDCTIDPEPPEDANVAPPTVAWSDGDTQLITLSDPGCATYLFNGEPLPGTWESFEVTLTEAQPGPVELAVVESDDCTNTGWGSGTFLFDPDLPNRPE